mgnify:CR=1 FL=1
MVTFAQTLTGLHGLVRWAAVVAASWMLALAIVALVRRRGPRPLDRRSLTMMTGVLHAQVGLGVLIAATLFAAGAPPFEGRSGTLIGHSLGGVLMASAATLAIVVGRRGKTPFAQSAWMAAFVALAWLLLGKWTISIPLVGVGLIAAFVLDRPSAPMPAAPTPPE